MIVIKGEKFPWFNRNAINDVILKWNTEDMKLWDVFEYGSGASTDWFSKRCKSITSVEHDKKWVRRSEGNKIFRLRKLIRGVDCEYVQSINEDTMLYDLIVIDGRNRVLCCAEAIKHLKQSGKLIFDNTERKRYINGINIIDSYFSKYNYAKYISPILKHDKDATWQTTIWEVGI